MVKGKDKDDFTPIVVPPPVPRSEPMPQTGCVVCGSYEGEMTGAAGHARWHSACEASRPDCIAKVRARA
jgi:hypothetical protein